MDKIIRAAHHHRVMGAIEKTLLHDAKIINLAERVYSALPATRSELATALSVAVGTVDKYLATLRLAGYKINAVGKSPDYVYEDGGE